MLKSSSFWRTQEEDGEVLADLCNCVCGHLQTMDTTLDELKVCRRAWFKSCRESQAVVNMQKAKLLVCKCHVHPGAFGADGKLFYNKNKPNQSVCVCSKAAS